MGLVCRRPSFAAVVVAVLVFELGVLHGGSKVRRYPIKVPSSLPFAFSICLPCRHHRFDLCFLRRAPHEHMCLKLSAAQIHCVSIASISPPPSSIPSTATITTFTFSIPALSLPVVVPPPSRAAAGRLLLLPVPRPRRRRRARRERFRFPRRHSWAPPSVYLHSLLVGGRWPSLWAPRRFIVLSSGGSWLLAIESPWLLCCCTARLFNTPPAGSFKMEKGTRYNLAILCVLFGNKYGSGNDPLSVRVDLQPWLTLVLRFNIEKSKANFLSPVKHIQYLRLKISNPRRHRPVRQPRGAPAVLSECNNEDPRCLWRGRLSVQRSRWRYHPCLLHQKYRNCSPRLSSIHKIECLFQSHPVDSFVIAQKLHLSIGMEDPKTMYSVLPL